MPSCHSVYEVNMKDMGWPTPQNYRKHSKAGTIYIIPGMCCMLYLGQEAIIRDVYINKQKHHDITAYVLNLKIWGT